MACRPYRVIRKNSVYIIGFKQIFLEENCVGCVVDGQSIFEQISQVGHFENISRVQQQQETARSSKISAGAAVSSDEQKLGGNAALDYSSSYNRTTCDQSETRAEIARVRRVAGGWRIGIMDGGDPIRGKMLDGTYMNAETWAKYEIGNGFDEVVLAYRLAAPLDMLTISRNTIPDGVGDADIGALEKIKDRILPRASQKTAIKNFLAEISSRKSVTNSLNHADIVLSECNLSIK